MNYLLNYEPQKEKQIWGEKKDQVLFEKSGTLLEI